MTDEPTWETNEVHLHIANTEPDYRAMLDCDTVEQLRDTFDGALPHVDYDEVDWEQVFDWFEEDRDGLE